MAKDYLKTCVDRVIDEVRTGEMSPPRRVTAVSNRWRSDGLSEMNGTAPESLSDTAPSGFQADAENGRLCRTHSSAKVRFSRRFRPVMGQSRMLA